MRQRKKIYFLLFGGTKIGARPKKVTRGRRWGGGGGRGNKAFLIFSLPSQLSHSFWILKFYVPKTNTRYTGQTCSARPVTLGSLFTGSYRVHVNLSPAIKQFYFVNMIGSLTLILFSRCDFLQQDWCVSYYGRIHNLRYGFFLFN